MNYRIILPALAMTACAHQPANLPSCKDLHREPPQIVMGDKQPVVIQPDRQLCRNDEPAITIQP